MHAISFQMKRCHLSAVALGRKVFRGTKAPDDPSYDGVPEMTPARFDILHLVLGKGWPQSSTPGTIELSMLRRLLGLARSTVSQAVKRLVELELVTCGLDPVGNQRNKIVEITEKGLAVFKKALNLVYNRGFLTRHYQRYVDPPPARGERRRWRPMRPWRVAEALREFRDDLEGLARHLFDDSAMLYNIHGAPEDW